MKRHPSAVPNSAAAPPARGPTLGLRLGVLATLVVTGTMAALSGAQQALDLRAELRNQQERLGDSLAPLVAELQTAPTRDAAAMALGRFHAAYFMQGHVDHHLAVVDASGRAVIATQTPGAPPRERSLTGRVPLVAPAIGPGTFALIVTTENSAFFAARDHRWEAWATHVGITALLMLAMLFVVIRREVTRPIDRLLEGVRKMELGYWDDIPDPGGAWEVRWLGWRFRTLGQELNKTVEHLVAAQRRAYAMDQLVPSDPDAVTERTSPAPAASILHAGAVIAQLQARLERLNHADPNDAADRAAAQSIWDHGAALAERLGRPELSIELEDAALRVLDPTGFLDVSARIDTARARLESLARTKEDQMQRALDARGVRMLEIQWRVKHPAGIWRKMRLKSLLLEQVHDLVALRIVVPAEADCYHALGVVHDLYAPIVGRFKDYVVAPKFNGYRSLHCSVRDTDGSVFEVQIRSIAMHRHAEMGSAAHANYRVATRVPTTSLDPSPWRRIMGLLRPR